MITCYLRYEVPLGKLAEFEAYGRMWLELVPRFGGIHHGYFLPSEGASDVALAMFSFPSLAAYEQYRTDSVSDPDVQKAIAFARQTRCFIRYERSFFRPVFPKVPETASS
ncbi:MAG: NIPSNAP family protein [Bradyrhizobium sp.]